jgi:hypothetical protein
MADPTIGVLHRREASKGARTVRELTDDPGKFVCDARVPLSEALATEWESDAHLQLYRLVDRDGDEVYARVTKKSPFVADLVREGGRVEVSILCLDHDLPGHREWTDPNEPLTWLAALPEGPPAPTVWYSTLHGSRLLYALVRPIPGPEAEALSIALVERWAAAGVALDRKCGDWTRLFRLPRTTREDSGLPFWRDPRFYMVDGGPELDPAALPQAEVRAAAEYAAAEPYEGDRPTAEECDALLRKVGESGRPVQTDFCREARRWLKGRESFPLAFEEAKFDPRRLAEGWNNCALFHVGQVVSMLAQLETASPEGCYALLRPALEALTADDEQGGRDWEAIGWDMVRRMWSVEEARLAAARIERERVEAEGAARREAIVATIRSEAPEVVPPDPEKAAEWIARRMIASDGSRHYVMRKDGSYNLSAVSSSLLVPMICDLGMEGTIPIKRLKGQRLEYRSAEDILAEHATPIVSVRCSVRERAASIDGPEGERTLRVPIHRLNPRLRPAFSADVDEWLRELFGSQYEAGLDWLAHSLEVRRPICALNLYGTPSAGKGMLCQGVSECFDRESPNDGRAMDRFNTGLLRSPVIWCDEGVPMIRGLGSTTDQVFRTLVAGGTIQIEGKMRDVIVADMYPRVIFASNDRDIVKGIVGNRDLTDDDVRAIEQRLLSIHVGPASRRLLESKGGYSYTRGWVAGEAPSRYVVANHVAFLHGSRKPSLHTTGRFLVEGELRTELVRDLRMRSDAALTVIRALARMLETPTPRKGLHAAEGRVWVTVSATTDYVESQGFPTKVSMSQVGHVLRQLATQELADGQYVKPSRPSGAPEKGRWIELDLTALVEECRRYGTACDRIESLMKMRPGGEGAIAEARAAAGV